MIKFIVLLFAASSLGALPEAPLRFERSIPLGDIQGRIDHIGFDAAGGRLFVAALGNNTVEVVDLRQNKVVRSIQGLSEPQGILYVPEFDRLYVANGGDGMLRTFDGSTFSAVASLALGDDADNMRYDDAAKRIYVGYGGGALGIVDAATDELVGTIPVAAHPESFQLESQGPRVFINVPRAGRVAVADRTRRAVGVSWEPSAGGNFPMALDEADGRLIVGCRSPSRLLVFDTASGREVAQVALHGDCDDLYYDRARRQVYASCGAGFIDVFSQLGANHFVRKAAVKTAPGGRTCFFAGDHLYVALPQRGNDSAQIWVLRVTDP